MEKVNAEQKQKSKPHVASEAEMRFRKTTASTKASLHVDEIGDVTIQVTRVIKTQEWLIEVFDVFE